MPQAHAEQRHPAGGGEVHGLERHPGVAGRAGTGRQHHRVDAGEQVVEFLHADGIRLDEVGVRSELLQVADERVHEAVVVVDHEHAGHSRSTSPGLTSGLTQGNTYQNRP